MRAFRHLSIRRKLSLILLFAIVTALLLAAAALSTYEILSYRATLARNLSNLAEVLGENSTAALEFGDKDTAKQILASVARNPQVRSIRLLDPQGGTFAEWRRAPGTDPAPPPADGHLYAGDLLVVARTVTLQNRTIGRIVLVAGLEELRELLLRYAAIVLLVTAASTTTALLVARRLQRGIVGPIADLADLTRRVSASRDYSIRAAAGSRDEVGVLVDGFNTMLAEIERRTDELRRAHDELEDRVRERTRELEAENAARRTAEESLQKTVRELARSNGELEQFAYAASHDLQEPLRKIQTFGDRLGGKLRTEASAQALDYLGRMQNAAQRMQTLIHDLLAFSRVATQTQPFRAVDLGQVLREVLGDLEVSIAQAGARVETTPLPSVEADPTQIRSLLQNLVGNALKYRKPEVPPQVRIRERLLHDGAILLEPGAEAVEFSVEDNGIGFDPKFEERIFGVFQRLHGRGEYEGSGVGLAICRKIVERHGGRIRAIGRPGEGASFHILLPRRQAAGGE